MSEFGRTARQNGNGGTDHGHASAMFVIGGDVKGKKVHGKWPGLEPEQLYEGRDLALTTDFRIGVLGGGVRSISARSGWTRCSRDSRGERGAGSGFYECVELELARVSCERVQPER